MFFIFFFFMYVQPFLYIICSYLIFIQHNAFFSRLFLGINLTNSVLFILNENIQAVYEKYILVDI